MMMMMYEDDYAERLQRPTILSKVYLFLLHVII